MAHPENLIPIKDSERARELQKKGAKKQGESKSRNAKIKKLLKEWGNRPVTKRNLDLLRNEGMIDKDDDATNISLVLMSIINLMMEGDIKAISLFLKLTGQDDMYDIEIKKKKEEIKKLKLEQEKLKVETGVNKDIENLDTLAEMLKEEPNANED